MKNILYFLLIIFVVGCGSTSNNNNSSIVSPIVPLEKKSVTYRAYMNTVDYEIYIKWMIGSNAYDNIVTNNIWEKTVTLNVGDQYYIEASDELSLGNNGNTFIRVEVDINSIEVNVSQNLLSVHVEGVVE